MHEHVLAYLRAHLVSMSELENKVSSEFKQLTTEVNLNKRHLGQDQRDAQLDKWFDMNRELDSICHNRLSLLVKTEERIQRLQRLSALESFKNIDN